MPVPELVAHRGYPRAYPENTLPGIEAAVRLGARFVEVDVQITRDGVPVLHHDRTLERVCGVPGAVHERTARELRQLRAGEPGRHGRRFADVPLGRLSDAVAFLLAWPAVTLFVDLKAVSVEQLGAARVVSAVLNTVEGLGDRAVPISHEPAAVAEVTKRSALRTGLVLRRWCQMEDGSAEALGPDLVFCRIDRLPGHGSLAGRVAPMVVYDSVDPSEARRLGDRGVAYVETFAIGEMLESL